MLVADAQREVRTAFVGGSMGQLVSGLLWLASAALATWGTPRQAITLLVLGGFFIFPTTQLGLKLLGHAGELSIVLGAHYLPFVFLYGMRMFAALGKLAVARETAGRA